MIKNQKMIVDSLKSIDRHLYKAIALRCVFRALPLLTYDRTLNSFFYWEKQDCLDNLFSLFSTLQKATFYSSNLVNDNPVAIELARNVNKFKAPTHRTLRITVSAKAIVSAIYFALHADVKEVIIAVLQAANEANHITYITSSTDNIKYESALISDLKKAKKIYLRSNDRERGVLDFLNYPLWSSEPVDEWITLVNDFEKSILQIDSSFEVWIQWYQKFIKGNEFDPKIEEKWAKIPAEIIEEGAIVTHKYLYSLQKEEDQEPLNIVRAIFIGNGAAGKTSLIRKLHNEPVVEGKEKMTPGIQIREWPIPQTEIKARFWDFGGQVISHSAHQFFLRERCLYILVLDARSEFNANDQAEYWLEHVKAFGKDSPVMLVGNKSDLVAVNLDMNRLSEKNQNIVGFYPLSCISANKKFKSLYSTFFADLILNLQKIDTHQVYFTKGQFKALAEIRELSSNNAFLKHNDFKRLCARYRIGGIGLSIEDFLRLLDNLGEVIYFPNLIRLNSFVLNPRWLTYGVYALLYSNIADKQHGILSESDVISILQHKSIVDEGGNLLNYSISKCGFIIDAMEEFKLSYRLPGNQRFFVIPDKMSSEQPTLNPFFNKNKPGTLEFIFDFVGFLPRHVMPSIIVSRHNEIASDNTGTQLVWQNGVVFENIKLNSISCIQVDYHQRILRIWVQGEGAKEYLSILNDEINKILHRLESLKYDEMIVLPKSARIDFNSNQSDRSVEKATYSRLLKEARRGNNIFISDEGNEYFLNKILGLIMTDKASKDARMNVIVNGNVGAIAGTGKNQAIHVNWVLNDTDQSTINELQKLLTTIMEYIQNHDAEFSIKANAYSELKQIHEQLSGIENIKPDSANKLKQLLTSVKNGSLDAIKMANQIKDAEESVGWLIEKATLVLPILTSMGM